MGRSFLGGVSMQYPLPHQSTTYQIEKNPHVDVPTAGIYKVEKSGI